MLAALKQKVWEANINLAGAGLTILTFGNVSGLDRRRGIFGIKPSGVPYEKMKPSDIVLVDLDGRTVEGRLKPSSDTPTHLELYRAFGSIGGIAHTHCPYATMFAQAGKEIPCLGTTHADVFNGPVPVTRKLHRREVTGDYEANTGRVIVERFDGLDPGTTPAVLVHGHGPFAWGATPRQAIEILIELEFIARTAFGTILLDGRKTPIDDYILKKHHERKHGPGAYYGQKKEDTDE